MIDDKKIENILIDDIIPNRFQPRLKFDEEALNNLANSIKIHGIIQPLVLRKINDKYYNFYNFIFNNICNNLF